MELTLVKSSHVAAVGYLDEDGVLLVRYHDGSLHARPGVSREQFESLLTAKSKGKFLHAMRGTSILISRKEAIAGNPVTQSHEQRAVNLMWYGPSAASAWMDVLDEDADQCCRRRFAVFPREEQVFTCFDCGTEFRATRRGALRHWQIWPATAIVRPLR